MTDSQQANNPGINDGVIEVIQADTDWIRYSRNRDILILAIIGIITITLSIIFQNLCLGIIRGLIFLAGISIVYFNTGFFYNYRIRFYRDGKIIVKKRFKESVISDTPAGSFHPVEDGQNWLLGIEKVKVPIDAFPDLDKKIKEIKY